jgi:hypothetical protein
MPNPTKPRNNNAKLAASVKRMQQAFQSMKLKQNKPRHIIQKKRRTPNAIKRNMESRAVMRRPVGPKSSPTRVCHYSALERITQVNIATNVAAGTLLYSLAANPTVSPRLKAVASQFDSWRGTMSLEVESTGNSLSTDYVIIRHVPNGDPARLPSNLNTLLNLAEASDRPGDSAKLQLDANRVAKVSAIWAESYNPKKPIIDSDPTECNLGQFIIVADGSPGTTSVNLTIRLRYSIDFFGAIFVPIIQDSSQVISTSGGSTGLNFFGSAPNSAGPGSATASGNTLTFPIVGTYTITSIAGGTGVLAPTAIAVGGTFISPLFPNVANASGTSSVGTWNLTTTTVGATFVINQAATTLVTAYVQINPYTKV